MCSFGIKTIFLKIVIVMCDQRVQLRKIDVNN